MGQVDIDFSALNLADTLSDFMKEDNVFLEPTQGTTLLASVILFFVFLMITTRFIDSSSKLVRDTLFLDSLL